MKITRKYLLAELSGPFLLGLGSFSLVVLLHRFSRVADLVIGRGCRPGWSAGFSSPSSLPPRAHPSRRVPPGRPPRFGAPRRRLGDRRPGHLRGGDARGGRPVLLAGGIVFSAALLVGWHGIPWGLQGNAARPGPHRSGADRRGRDGARVPGDHAGHAALPDRVSADGQRMDGIFLTFRPAGDEPLLVFARMAASRRPGGRRGEPGPDRRDDPQRPARETGVPAGLLPGNDVPVSLEIPDALGEDDRGG